MTKRAPRKRRAELGTSQALATELGALLERLDIPAVLTDRHGQTLAATRHAEVFAKSAAHLTHRVVELRLNGQAICVAVPRYETVASLEEITPRQRTVLELIREGLQNKEIGERLGISLHTVRRHVEALLVRLNVPTRAAAAVLLQHQSRSADHASPSSRRSA